MNLSTSTINSLAKYFFPFCQQLNFIFLLLPSKSIFHFFPPSLTGVACWCACCAAKSVRANTGMCLIFSFACVAACTRLRDFFLGRAWCAAPHGCVLCIFISKSGKEEENIRRERECGKNKLKILFRYQLLQDITVS